MTNLRLEIHVMAEQENYARHQMSWDAALREAFDYQGGGEWHTNGTYLTRYEQDRRSLEDMERFVNERFKDYGITEFYTQIEEFDGWVD